jgi:hypothetical protein
VSKQCGLFGELKGMSDEDTARLIANRSYEERQNPE